MKRGRSDDEGDVVLIRERGERIEEREGKGFGLAEEVGVGEVETGGGVDEERGGGGGGGVVEKRECVVDEREGLGWRRERDGWPHAVEGLGL